MKLSFSFLLPMALSLFISPSGILAGRSHSTRARGSGHAHHHHGRNTTGSSYHAPANAPYKLVDEYKGQDFFNQFDFFTDADPTHGNVKYLSRSAAQKNGLAYVNSAGNFIMAVDSTNPVSVNGQRNSVRISSQASYTNGLFIADIKSMPHGCSVWPAYWTVGPNWPNGGEIDVLEGVHNQFGNQMTLHTSPSPGCQASNNVPATARLATQQCAFINGDNTGCAFVSDDGSSYGEGLNDVGGGIYAHEWTDSSIKIWFFARSQIPQDISSQTPDPSTWGAPNAQWNANSCNIGSHFSDHVITFDISLCGDWAGATFNSAGCPGTCGQFITDPDNFKNAFWEVGSVSVYK